MLKDYKNLLKSCNDKNNYAYDIKYTTHNELLPKQPKAPKGTYFY